MRKYKLGDIVITDVSKEHKRICEIVPNRDRVVLEWWSGLGRECEEVHISHLHFISKRPTQEFNYFYLLHPR